MRGKKGYRARSYAGFRRTRIAPRGRMSPGGAWSIYLLILIAIVIASALAWRHYH